MIQHRHSSRAERGSLSVSALFLVVVCAGVSAAALLSNVGATREAETLLFRERAFQAAEAGLDWGLTRLRVSHGELPAEPLETGALDSTASFEIRYRPGISDGIDENGDGVVDDAGEADYSSIVATGISGGVRRSVQAILVKPSNTGGMPSTALINVDGAILDLDGNSFIIDGREHFIDGTLDTARAAKFGVASLGDADAVAAQIAANWQDQVIGLGTPPSTGQAAAVDLSTLVEQAKEAASVVLAPGTHSGGTYGTPTPSGVIAVASNGDLHLSSGSSGAGILVVDGDLDISGGFQWVGIILVRGRINLVGGGSGTRIIGAMIMGEELRITGTVDSYYSSDAVALAMLALQVPRVVSWKETGNP